MSSCHKPSKRHFYVLRLELERLKPGIDRKFLMKAFQAEGVLLHDRWGETIIDMGCWNVPPERYKQYPIPVSLEAMHESGLFLMGNLLLADDAVIDKVAEGIGKVMRECAE